jgi:hypothetical protein
MRKTDIDIAAPCTLDWTKMTPAEGGRFCGSCKKVVRDLSGMNETEARALLRRPHNEELCVRYVHDAQGNVFFAEDLQRRAMVSASFLNRAKRVASAAVALAAPVALAACSLPGAQSDSSDPQQPDLREMMGGMPYRPDPVAPHDDAGTDAAGGATADAFSDSPTTPPDGGDAGAEKDSGTPVIPD